MPSKKGPVLLSPLDEYFGEEFGQKFSNWEGAEILTGHSLAAAAWTERSRALGQLSLYLDFVPNKELLLKLAQQGLMFLNSFKFDNKDIWAGRY